MDLGAVSGPRRRLRAVPSIARAYLAIPAVLSVLILAYVAYNAVYAVTSFPAGVLADRFGRPVAYGVGLVFFAVGYLGLGITTNPVAAWGLIAVYGIFTACYDGVGKAWISTLVGGDLQSSAQGVFQGLSGFAVLAAGLWAGFLWGADGRLPLLISGVVGAVFAVVLLGAAAGTRRRADPLDLNPTHQAD